LSMYFTSASQAPSRKLLYYWRDWIPEPNHH
jgi:hypothetical protein